MDIPLRMRQTRTKRNQRESQIKLFCSDQSTRAVLFGRDDVGSAMMAWGGVAAVQTGIVQVGWGVETITKAVSGNLEQGRSFFVPIPSIMRTFLEVLE